jgi:hypothetical protein
MRRVTSGDQRRGDPVTGIGGVLDVLADRFSIALTNASAAPSGQASRERHQKYRWPPELSASSSRVP